MEPTMNCFPRQKEANVLSPRLSLRSLIRLVTFLFITMITSGISAQISFNVDILRSTCPGQFLGAIEINSVTGGTPPYMYSIDNGMTYQSSPTFTGLDVGPYSVRVRDPFIESDPELISPDLPPTARCQQVTVSLQNDGMAVVLAESFDKVSSDDCGPIWFRVRRMTASNTCLTDNNPDNLFYDSLKVCCDDIPGDTVLVEFRVYDRDPGSGPIKVDTLLDRSSLCMTSVKVLDELGPELIQCPQPYTVDCKEDFTDLSRFGYPDVRDNCALVDSVYTEMADLNQCREGEIVRSWTFTDQSGGTTGCTQIITVENYTPFNGGDTTQLNWPADFTVYGCSTVNTHPDSTGYPEINEDECSQVAFFWDDDVYQFAPDACVKIRRHWTVLDWCQYDRSQPRSEENGVWTYTQEIKIVDIEAPILEGPADTLVFSYSADCNSEIFVDLPPVLAEDCADSADLEYRIEVDLNFDGNDITHLTGNNASGFYPIGEHLITFIVDDKCNNVSKWETILAVQDGKAPNAVQINRLIVPLIEMGNGGMASVTASQFDLKSYDNCTPSENLRFSFSADVNDTVRVYDCDSLGSRLVTVWVTDEAGNQGFAVNYVEIQDNDGVCPGTVTAQLNGQVTSFSGDPLEHIALELSGGSLHEMAKTDADGLYAFSTIGAGQNVRIRPISPEEWMTGISTKDIIVIQQYLLGIYEFDRPEQLIAADVDASGHISTRDIISLRKLILGLSEMVHGNESWRFVDKNFVFGELESVLKKPFPELCSFTSEAGLQAASFTAVKTGDVTGDAAFGDNSLVTRTNTTEWQWSWKNSAFSGENRYSAYSSQDKDITGFQVEILSEVLRPGLTYKVEPSAKLNEQYFFWQFTEKGIRVQYAGVLPVSLDPGDPIMRIVTSDQKVSDGVSVLSEKYFNPEYYDDQLNTGRITFNNSDRAAWTASIAPNPSSGSTSLTVKGLEQGACRVDIYGINGFKLHSLEFEVSTSGESSVNINLPVQAPEGLYLIRVSGQDQQIQVLKWHFKS